MSDLHTPASDNPCVPVRSLLRPSTYRALAPIAEARGTDVGGLLALLADRSITPKPATAKRRGPARQYLRATQEQLDTVRRMNRDGATDGEIAAALGIEKHQAYYLRLSRLGLPGNG